MPLTKEQLIATANVCAVQSGLPQIGESVFESWISKGLLDRAKAYGKARGINPEWLYPDEAELAVKQIMELRAQGAKRTSELIICLWVLQNRFEPHEVLSTLKSEFQRLIKRQLRAPAWWRYSPDDQENMSDSEREKILKRMPQLDPDLAATPFALPQSSYLKIMLEAYWGSDDSATILETVSREFPWLNELPLNPILSALNISGALGPPDESATGGYQLLDRISRDDLEVARGTIWLMALVLGAMELILDVFGCSNSAMGIAVQKASNSVLRPDWIIYSMSLFAIAHYQTRRMQSASKN